MIELKSGAYQLRGGVPVPAVMNADGREKTMAYSILRAHDSSKSSGRMELTFDSLISHDITYVGIIQTAKASGLERFPVPYVLTNCHNSLCAVGGTINEDDHVFGLSAAKRFGGIYVPANLAVIHQYAREKLSGVGRMVLGSDSHTRYGPMGTMGVGEGGPELVRQLLENTYDIASPEVVLVWVTGKPRHGVGPHDVAIALCGAVYDNGFVKNKVMEFAGPGISDLPMDYRIGIDVMTTEMACLSSIWTTDEKVKEYLTVHGRPEEYRAIAPEDGAVYDSMIVLDLSKIEPMAALPFHPSKAYTLRELSENAGDILRQCEKEAEKVLTGGVRLKLTDKLVNGRIVVNQGIIGGCSGGMYDNIAEAAAILDGRSIGNGYFSLSVYPPSVPVNMALLKSGVQQSLMESGALFKSCFCGPCFGAGDTPSNDGLSIRHATRNFLNREGSKPGDGQLASVFLMDARSIAATAANGGVLTSAADMDYEEPAPHAYEFDDVSYRKRVYNGYGAPDESEPLRYGPNIAEWPKMPALADNLLIRLDSVIHDPVTTTDELIPSGETSSYRSNPIKLASFALSRRDPAYVGNTHDTAAMENARSEGKTPAEVKAVLNKVGAENADFMLGSSIYATMPGDGSAREQAASCQRVLGGSANICREFATKRYRSNVINWGMLPLLTEADEKFDYNVGDYVYLPNIRETVKSGKSDVEAYIVSKDAAKQIKLHLAPLTDEEREILLAGCLMNWYAERRKK